MASSFATINELSLFFTSHQLGSFLRMLITGSPISQPFWQVWQIGRFHPFRFLILLLPLIILRQITRHNPLPVSLPTPPARRSLRRAGRPCALRCACAAFFCALTTSFCHSCSSHWARRSARMRSSKFLGRFVVGVLGDQPPFAGRFEDLAL